MTVKSGFFSNGASYNQADFNAFLLDSIGSGYVLGYGNELEVSANSPANMGVYVKTGRCYVQGYYGWVTANEALTVPTANPTKPRIDRVVARLSVSVNQSVTFAVLTGTPATTPTPPALTRTSETYEISLARIFVGAGVTSISAANITDERTDATVCGVAGVKHSWSYLNNVVIDVSGMTVDAGVSNRSPVYFNGTKWVVATSGAVGFYDKPNAAVITAGYLDGFTGLTPGAIVSNRGVALSATKIVVLESPINNSGVKQVGDITGNLTGYLKHNYHISPTAGMFNLGTIIPEFSGTQGNSTADYTGDVFTGLLASVTSYNAITPAFDIFSNTGLTYPFNVTVSYETTNMNSSMTLNLKNAEGSIISTITTPTGGTGSATISVTSSADKLSFIVRNQITTSKTVTMPNYYASFG